jgi:hypothetical protein
MTPETVPATIQAVASATREMFAFLQTPEGQEILKKSREDRAAFDKWFHDAGAWLTSTFERIERARN